jgi:autoinducer 2 (AI-2) kinase
VLVVDAGTSALRAIRVDGQGSPTTLAVVPWKIFTPGDGSAFARELRGEDVERAIRDLMERAAPLAGPIAGVALTGQREGVAFLDAEGAPLLVSPNVDGRASSEGMAIDERWGERIYAVTGHLPALMQAAAKLHWLRAQRSRDAARVATIMPLVDWLGMLLGGERAASRSLAAENGLIDITSGEVAVDLLAALDVDAALVPRIVADGALVGALREGALSGAPVALAGADTQCALVGMERLAGGAGVVGGWSAPVQLVAPAPILDAESRIWTGMHVTAARWVLESNAGECGRAWEWLCSMMCVTYDEAERLAGASPPGSRDALAVLGARQMHAARMTLGVGALTVPLPLVMSQPERGEVLRSALEAIACGVRANVEQLERTAGARIDDVALGGGLSRSQVFGRILADVLDRPVEVAGVPETSAVGAAAVVSPVLGLHDTIESAAGAHGVASRRIEPKAKDAAAYEDVYVRWCRLAETLEQGTV